MVPRDTLNSDEGRFGTVWVLKIDTLPAMRIIVMRRQRKANDLRAITLPIGNRLLPTLAATLSTLSSALCSIIDTS